jgi:hypothetical protein
MNRPKHRSGYDISVTLLLHFFNISSIAIEEMLKKCRQHVVNQPISQRRESAAQKRVVITGKKTGSVLTV